MTAQPDGNIHPWRHISEIIANIIRDLEETIQTESNSLAHSGNGAESAHEKDVTK